ncbi:uncharacterized protein LOC114841341 [Diachasma alloeum]|uniref:uncharacterized protein LOC114841317 n=1 Tax=Diachasma alloeum TaxID=454923 RepID=UPI0010FB7393|nr:uncharacterized protein LOC114841317 [Diachasma alloeum]XP_028982118.1 uncharacterized protein LOC114841341 [Diachasma alloeum]
MSVDVFGRQLSYSSKTTTAARRGPPGDGFKRTLDGNYSIEGKRLCNIADPVEEFDAISLHFLRENLRKEIDEVKKSVAADFIEKLTAQSRVINEPEELHRPARRNFKRRHVDVRGLDETWQADLVEMIPYANSNKNYRYLLTVIDIFSKYAWAIPTKSKNAADVTSAMNKILKEGRVPTKLHVDQGKEFYNKDFQALMKKNKISMYSTFSNVKASICERFNRTLKNKMWKQFSILGTYKWIDIVDDLVAEYNNTKHRTIKMKPKDVTIKNEKSLLKHIYEKLPINRTKKIKFKVGDKVRISKYKTIFEKGYTPNWTTEVFTIQKVQKTNPVTYKLVDGKNEAIKGGFYQEELSGVKHPDVFLVEKVLRRKGKKEFVKWLGFDDTHNSWIDANQM